MIHDSEEEGLSGGREGDVWRQRMREYGDRSCAVFPVSVYCSSHSLGEQGRLVSEQSVANIFGSAEFGDDFEYVRPLLQSLDQISRERVDLTRSRYRPCQYVSIGAVLASYCV